MKVRIGFGLGTRASTDPGRFRELVDALEDLGFDSLWLSERISGDCPDPVVGLSAAAGRTERLKLGFSVLVVPGRNPMLLAKQLATLDRLSDGRLLPAFGLGVADPVEQQAFGVARRERARLFDEIVPVLRRLWAGEVVDHDGSFRYQGARVHPTPVQDALEIWLGGVADSELLRCGRHGDGWLPSFCAPSDISAGIRVINAEAARHGRSIDPEHIGALIPYTEGPVPPEVMRAVERRRPDLDPADIVAAGLDGLARRIERFIAVGASKFVVVPVAEPSAWDTHLGAVATTLLPLET